jgi:hypothetical protein
MDVESVFKEQILKKSENTQQLAALNKDWLGVKSLKYCGPKQLCSVSSATKVVFPLSDSLG